MCFIFSNASFPSLAMYSSPCKEICFDAEQASKMRKRVRSLYGLSQRCHNSFGIAWWFGMELMVVLLLVQAVSPHYPTWLSVPYDTYCKREDLEMDSKKWSVFVVLSRIRWISGGLILFPGPRKSACVRASSIYAITIALENPLHFCPIFGYICSTPIKSGCHHGSVLTKKAATVKSR